MTTGPTLANAACRQLSPAAKADFSAEPGLKAAAAYERAKAVCASCVEQPACLEWAREMGEVYVSRGKLVSRFCVWGGVAPDVRRRPEQGLVGTAIGDVVVCKQCRRSFTAIGTGQRYCGEECARAARTAAKAQQRRARAS